MKRLYVAATFGVLAAVGSIAARTYLELILSGVLLVPMALLMWWYDRSPGI